MQFACNFDSHRRRQALLNDCSRFRPLSRVLYTGIHRKYVCLLLRFSQLKFSSRVVVVITPINACHKAGWRTQTYTPTCFIDHAQHMLATGAIYRQLTPLFKGQRTTQFIIDNRLPTTSTPAVYTPTICIW